MNKAMKNLVLTATAIALNCLVLPSWAEESKSSSRALDQQEVVKPDPTLVQRLRELLNVTPPSAVGGSRNSGTTSICLINPRISSHAENSLVVNVIASRPTILVSGSLNEIRLQRDRGVRTIWIQQASSIEAIEGPIDWPLEPLTPGEVVTLKLRPRGATGGESISIELRAGSASDFQRTERLIKQLGNDADQWQAAIIEQLKSNPALALTLAIAVEAPAGISNALIGLECGAVNK